MLRTDTVLTRNADILYVRVGADQGVMMSLVAGKYYGLNSVAARIWELLARPMTIAELSRAIYEEFDVDLDTCEASIVEFMAEAVNERIIRM